MCFGLHCEYHAYLLWVKDPNATLLDVRISINAELDPITVSSASNNTSGAGTGYQLIALANRVPHAC